MKKSAKVTAYNPGTLNRLIMACFILKEPNETITTPIISDFIGTLEINGVNKGVFITTTYFQKDFESALQNINKIIILIDGNRLGELMIEYNIGVITENVYEIKKIDSDFFSSDQ